MPRIEMSDLMQGYSQITPEQINLIKWFYQTFDNRSAANRRIINVEPLFYQGAIAGTEFLTYAATKLYICLQFDADYYTGITLTPAIITLYSEANATFNYISNQAAFFNEGTAALTYQPNSLRRKNFYFSRLTNTGYAHFSFNGFRITLV